MRDFLKRWIRAFARDDGVAGIVIAILVSIVAFSALAVFMAKFSGPWRETPRVQRTSSNSGVIEAAVLVYLNINGTLPCPDTDATPDGLADTCNATGTTAGTLPWATLDLGRSDAIDGYGTLYSYVVSAEAKDVCVAVGSDFDAGVDPTYTGEVITSDELEVRLTTQAAGEGTYVPFVVFSHGANKLGGISSSGTAYGSPVSGSNEEDNADAAPSAIFSGPYDTGTGSAYFDDVVFAPSTAKLEAQCEGNTPSGQVNAEISEPFTNGIDADKLESSPGGDAPTAATDSDGNAVASLTTTSSYFISAASFRFDASEKPLYIATDWTPDPNSAGATTAGFSIITRATGTPTGDILAQGITFRVSGNIDAGGEPGDLDILNNGVSLTPTEVGTPAFQLRSARKYLIEVYDNGNSVWMKIEQADDPTNRAYAYVDTGDIDNTGTQRVYLVNGANTVSYIDNVMVGIPMLAMDTYGAGYAHTGNNGDNGTSSGAFTIEGWFKPRALPGTGQQATLISQWNANNLANSSFRLFMTEGGALSLSVGSGTITIDTETLGVSLTAGEWVHLAVTYDAGNVVLYKNSKAAARLSNVLAGAAIRAPNARFAVGATWNSASGGSYQNIYDGAVSDVRVWDIARSSFQVLQWYNHRLPLVNTATALTNLIVNWRFDLESGGFTSASVNRAPNMSGGTDSDGTLAGGAAYVVTRLLDFRTISTDICGPGDISVSGNRVGPYRCDFRDAETGTITGENLGGLVTFYGKVWGAGGGSDTDGSGSTIWDGGGGGFAGGLFLNNGSDLAITAGTGGTGGTTSGNGVTSFADQGAPRLQGTRGVRASNTADGTSGGATAANMLNSELDSSTTRGRIPGCIPAITVVGNACTDPYFSVSGGPTLNPHFGYGGDADGGGLFINGQDGLVVLFW